MGRMGIFFRYGQRPKKNTPFEDIFEIPYIPIKSKPEIIDNLLNNGQINIEEVYKIQKTRRTGLTKKESLSRLNQYGLNEIAHEKKEFWLIKLFKAFINPLNFLLLGLVIISFLTKDPRTAGVIFSMICLSVGLKFYQEQQAFYSANKLKSLVKTTVTVIRNNHVQEIDIRFIVPGDIIELCAGDLIPGDLRLIESRELFVNQSVLTGESLPVEKHVVSQQENIDNPLDLQNICLMGANVESGHAIGVIFQTGQNTYFGNLAKDLVGQRQATSFDRGINKFTWMMMAFMAVMVPMVFFINGFARGNWIQALMFAVSVAVGLTPEMLPALVAINLSKGSITLSKKKVIVKRLNSIQNFGAMDILCTDKTGTLTQNKIVLIHNVNIQGKNEPKVLQYAFINSSFQTGFKNLLDSAVISHAITNKLKEVSQEYKKIDELPFDFKRRRISVIAQDKKERYFICKGAVEELLSICAFYEIGDKIFPLDKTAKQKIIDLNIKYAKDGFRVIAIAYKNIKNGQEYFTYKDEQDLVFSGVMTFLDPPKESAAEAIEKLKGYGIETKILTGDNELVTKKIAQEVGVDIKGILLGTEIEKITDLELQTKALATTIFAKLSPNDKKRVVFALQNASHVVGYLGDGINDAPALRTADVGISVNSAVDVAKESADMILLEMSLGVLAEGVVEGRKVFGNIIKYIKMGASSNFGNMFSLVGGSIFLPFLPMTPAQILANNFLYDLSQTAIPSDIVDREYLAKPRKWDIGDIGRFMLFIGPISSIFDYATFFIMLYLFKCWNNAALFQTGWFIESLATQTLIIHVIRSRKMPFFQTWASKALVATTITVTITGIILVLSPLSAYFGFTTPPAHYWPILLLILLSYITLTQIVKTWYIKKFGYN